MERAPTRISTPPTSLLGIDFQEEIEEEGDEEEEEIVHSTNLLWNVNLDFESDKEDEVIEEVHTRDINLRRGIPLLLSKNKLLHWQKRILLRSSLQL